MLTIKQVSKRYGELEAVKNIDLRVKPGQILGFLGPNGAGKTTTIRNIMGFSNANKGKVTIAGLDARTDTAKLQERIGYLPGEIAFFENMTGMEFLTFMGKMRRLKSLEKRDTLIKQFELDPKGKIKKMSKGMKQKVGIVAAFMHDPDIIILDEPTSGLDPFMQNVFMDLIDAEKSKGKTIMMSSHIFEEVQRSCDRAGIIRDGRLVAIEDIHSLKAMNKKRFRVIPADEESKTRLLASDFSTEQKEDGSIILDQNGSLNNFFALMASCDIKEFDVITQSLEDIFMKYYGEEKTHE